MILWGHYKTAEEIWTFTAKLQKAKRSHYVLKTKDGRYAVYMKETD